MWVGCTLKLCFLPLSPHQAPQWDENQTVLRRLCLRSWVAEELVPRRRDAALPAAADQLPSACPKPKTCTSAAGTALASSGVSLVRLPMARAIFHEVLFCERVIPLTVRAKDAWLFLKADVQLVCFCCFDGQTEDKRLRSIY